MLVHQLVNQGQANRMALWFKQQQVTYQELQHKVDLYRRFLYAQGVRQGDNVGLISRNSVEFVYSYLAVASLGAVVVPINFQLVAREIAFIVQNAGIKVLITRQPIDLASELNKYGYTGTLTQLVIPEFDPQLPTMELPAVPPVDIKETDPCTIIYTSGTTGNPKGAVLTHKNLISNAHGVCQILPINAEDNVLCVLPMYHCFAWTCAVLTTLLQGAGVVILETFAVRDTVAVIAEQGVTVVYAVPPMYQLLAGWNQPADLAGVKLFVSGGAALPLEIINRFASKIGKTIVEGYDLSEASPVVSINSPHKVKPTSIGRALPGVDVRIMWNGRELPRGEIGELVVRGPNVMAGYFGLPEETAKTIEDGWLHTGDLGYMDKEGYLYIVDRLKDLIITSGENIYPREIEEVLYSHPAIAEAAVVGVPDKLRGQVACAYVVLKEGQEVDVKALRTFLLENLAAYKVPRDFIFVPELPKNSTGKILKRVLREQATAV